MPAAGPKLFLSGVTLSGWLKGPVKVLGSTLKRPVKAAVLRELIGTPKYS